MSENLNIGSEPVPLSETHFPDDLGLNAYTLVAAILVITRLGASRAWVERYGESAPDESETSAPQE
jgi:hypothetical protein